ncbi:MAG: ECF transporter S component [Blautia sp.]|nr:ECF transporter S component [Blautia sp.]
MNQSTAASNRKREETSTIRKLVFVAILGAISFVLMLVNFSVPFAPSFMKFDIAELPGLFAGFFLGPLAGFEVVLVKLALKLAIQGTETAFVGEFSNLVGSAVFVVTAAWIYKLNRTKKGAIIALGVSTLVVSVAYIFLNAYIMFPLYSRLYGIPLDAIVGMGTAINPRITNLTTMMLFSVFPFNLVKHLATDLLTLLVYKRIANALRGLLYN